VEGEAVDGQSEPQWRVEGAESSYGDGGLGDTVVRLPKITDDAKPAPAKPRQRTGRTGTQPKVGADGLPVAASKPAEPVAAPAPKPVAEPKPVPVAAAAPVIPAPTAVPTPFAPPVVAAAPAPAPTLPPPPFSRPQGYAEPTAVQPAPRPVATGPVSPAPAAKSSSLRRVRKARLRLSKVDPWSVMKTVFLFSIAFGIMFWVAVSVVWTVVSSSGLFDVLNQAVVNILSSPNSTANWRIEDYVNANKVLGIAALLAVVNVVISTALGTLTAFLYNLSANILGGLELTLAED
jgi:hypothetical protein